MKKRLSLLLVPVTLLGTGALADAQSFGSIAGTIRDQAKGAVSGATITATKLDDSTTRTASSAPDGTYRITDVVPGMYSVMAQKPGYSDFVLAQVQVTTGQMAIADIVMAPISTGPVTNAAPLGFWRRFAKAYWDDWHPAPDPTTASVPTVPGAEPAYRGDPPPESNPPYPFNIWPQGGTPGIGYNTTTQYPLTTALLNGPHGEWWKKANVQIYGWADVGMNISTSTAKPYGNAPAAYALIPNSVQLDQLTLYIERVPDTVQTDHFDWGFRLTNLYGLDYRFTTSEGYFSQQLLTPKANGTLGNKYGYDKVMAYVDLYFPHIGQGTDVRIGRYVSLPDIEAQLAPNNYSYSHSLTYTYDCYTQSGINITTKISNHWTLQEGLSGGCEAAPWAKDATLTGNVCLAYTWTEGRDQVYTCANSINSGKYNYNNLAAYYFTWYHHFGHSRWHADWETWYQYMKDTPNVTNPAASSLLIPNSNGAVCNNGNELTCFAPEWSTLTYVNYQISKKDFISVRNEYFDDLTRTENRLQDAVYGAHDFVESLDWIDGRLPAGDPVRLRLRHAGIRQRHEKRPADVRRGYDLLLLTRSRRVMKIFYGFHPNFHNDPPLILI